MDQPKEPALIRQNIPLGSAFASVRRIRACGLAAQRRFGGRAVQGLPLPTDAPQFFILFEQQALEPVGHAGLDPCLEAPVQGRAGGKRPGRDFPLTARAQDIENAIQHSPERNRRSAASPGFLFLDRTSF